MMHSNCYLGLQLLEKLNHERSHVSDVIRQEFADRIVSTEEENKRIKNDMSELKVRHSISYLLRVFEIIYLHDCFQYYGYVLDFLGEAQDRVGAMSRRD